MEEFSSGTLKKASESKNQFKKGGSEEEEHLDEQET